MRWAHLNKVLALEGREQISQLVVVGVGTNRGNDASYVLRNIDSIQFSAHRADLQQVRAGPIVRRDTSHCWRSVQANYICQQTSQRQTGPDAQGNLTDSDGEALPPSWASRYAATCFISFWTGERRIVSDASWCVVQCDGKGGHADSLRRRV